MKLYVIPIGVQCNARCPYCITKFRKLKSNILDVGILRSVLDSHSFEKIEITGGGEPSLHPQINEIIELCSQKCPTNIYTNGSLTTKNEKVQVCISRAHYDAAKNMKIMGMDYDIDRFSSAPNLKLSLMLHKSGIANVDELKRYLDWAKSFASKVVIRQLFEYEDPGYQAYYEDEYVSSIEMAKEFGRRFPTFDGLDIEFEERGCACEDTSPVLTADGRLVKGWGEA